MDNVGYEWERGFNAGADSQIDLLVAARRRITELERDDFVPRCDLIKAEQRVAQLTEQVSIQADAIRRLAKKANRRSTS